MNLLKTKLYIPPIPREWVPRPRLIERLDTGVHRKLTVISAAAGYGKTTLLSHWVRGHLEAESPDFGRAVWLSLDRDDNDPSRFWAHFIAALQTAHPDIGEFCLSMHDSPDPPPIESILTILINEISGKPDKLVVVLDDYHEIRARRIHEHMTFLLDHLPSQVHLVIASRVDPPLPVARLRGRGQLNELRTADLRFTFDETKTFLNQVMSLDLSDTSLEFLESRTEGWIASLQMAAISMQGREDVSDFARAFSGTHQYIMDYLTEEVLQCQEENVRSFLLETSILDHLSGPLCNAVTERNDSLETLEQLAKANLFLLPADDERKWFRYHPFFADLLRNRLNRLQPDSVPRFHCRASEWFQLQGLMHEAVKHALAGQDFDHAADMIESIAVPMVAQSRFPALRAWLGNVPGEVIASRPWLCVCLAGVNLSAGKFDAAEPLLQTAESLLAAAPQERFSTDAVEQERIRGHLMALRATLIGQRGDSSYAIQLCNEALEHLTDEQPTVRCMLTFTLGRAHYQRGHLAIATRYLNETMTLGQETGNCFAAIVAASNLADIQAQRGHLFQAAETTDAAIQIGTRWGGEDPLPATSYAYLAKAEVLYQQNEIDQAMRYVVEGIELNKEGVASVIALAPRPSLVLLARFAGQSDGVMEAIDRAKGIILASHSTAGTCLVDAWLARLALTKGDVPAVQRWAEAYKYCELSLHDIPDYWDEVPYLTLVRLRIAQGDTQDMSDALDGLRHKAEDEERMGRVIEILILQSIALQAQRKEKEAQILLERALSLAEPEGYVRVFVDEGQPMLQLLKQAASAGIHTAYAGKLLASFHTPDGEKSAPTISDAPPRSLAGPLTSRELEILRLIAAGKSNRQIADDLFVVKGTVKNHLINIYGKLDVHSRAHAVARAAEMGLL